jgi:hypothetical protein
LVVTTPEKVRLARSEAVADARTPSFPSDWASMDV